jgi:hypothetical protein
MQGERGAVLLTPDGVGDRGDVLPLPWTAVFEAGNSH